MKLNLLFCLLLAVTAFSSCQNEKKADSKTQEMAAPEVTAPAVQASPDLTPVPDPTNANATPPPPSPAQNAKGVWHYTCPKGCAGGAGVQGNCAKCGGALAHNPAYHQ